MLVSPIYKETENLFLVVESTPYTGYETVFSGSSIECLTWCKEHRRSAVNALYKMTKVEEDLLVIIISVDLLDSARSSHIQRVFEEQ